mmetsp:Transcript_85619/g.276333  ORF Transcript_85619/g.276333 Transcript_85619/m.276333 type:complete len:207 (+) Transcript_85619:765-1385(+)
MLGEHISSSPNICKDRSMHSPPSLHRLSRSGSNAPRHFSCWARPCQAPAPRHWVRRRDRTRARPRCTPDRPPHPPTQLHSGISPPLHRPQRPLLKPRLRRAPEQGAQGNSPRPPDAPPSAGRPQPGSALLLCHRSHRPSLMMAVLQDSHRCCRWPQHPCRPPRLCGSSTVARCDRPRKLLLQCRHPSRPRAPSLRDHTWSEFELKT